MGNMIFQCKCCDRNKWNKDEVENEIRNEKNENNYLTANDLRIIIKNGFSKQIMMKNQMDLTMIH